MLGFPLAFPDVVSVGMCSLERYIYIYIYVYIYILLYMYILYIYICVYT